jgi:hypothetical protein
MEGTNGYKEINYIDDVIAEITVQEMKTVIED